VEQHELIARYEAERPLFEAWGQFVTNTVMERLPGGGKGLIKVPPQPRTKTVESLVQKAYYRGKGYTDPYAEITDKVGTRFVVLLLEEIQTVCDVIKACTHWSCSVDRDFNKDRQQYPNRFEYQSNHLVVRASEELVYDGESVPVGTPCEIQVRTLMQHAFSELTHDTVYKAEVAAAPEVQRAVAKSMALIETTDDLFAKVDSQLSEANKPIEYWIDASSRIYSRVVGRPASDNPRMNAYLVDRLLPFLDGITPNDVEEVVRKFPLGRWIDTKWESSFLYQQPTIVLVYYLVEKRRYDLRRNWPFPQSDLSGAFTDLGYAIED